VAFLCLAPVDAETANGHIDSFVTRDAVIASTPAREISARPTTESVIAGLSS
jgi:hypothetical protein